MISIQKYKIMLVNGFSLLLTCSIIQGSFVRFNPLHLNKVLEGQVLEAKKVPTFSVCIYECMVTTDCLSFNYFMDERLCVFHSENSSTTPQCLFEATGRIGYSDISIWPKVSESYLCSQYCAFFLYKQIKLGKLHRKLSVENVDNLWKGEIMYDI